MSTGTGMMDKIAGGGGTHTVHGNGGDDNITGGTGADTDPDFPPTMGLSADAGGDYDASFDPDASLTLTGTATNLTAGATLIFAWDFDLDGIVDDTNANPVLSWEDRFFYGLIAPESSITVDLTVSDDTGNVDSDQAILTVPDQSYTFALDVDLDGDGSTGDGYLEEGGEINIGLNDDDDNGNATVDLNETGPLAAADDDLVLIEVFITTDKKLGKHGVIPVGDGLRFWTDALKTEEITDSNPFTISDNSSAATIPIYLEGVSEGSTSVTFDLVTVHDSFVQGGRGGVGAAMARILKQKSADWIKVLNKAEKPHKGKLYYKPAKVAEFFKSLRDSVKHIGKFVQNADSTAKAEYRYVVDWMSVPKLSDILSTPTETAVRETVHVLDDIEGWYINGGVIWNIDEAERLAYGATAFLDALDALARLEDKANDGTLTPENAATALWPQVITSANSIRTTAVWVGGTIDGTVGTAGVQDVNARLGLTLDFSALLPLYQNLLNNKGIAYTLQMDIQNGPSLHNVFRGP